MTDPTRDAHTHATVVREHEHPGYPPHAHSWMTREDAQSALPASLCSSCGFIHPLTGRCGPPIDAVMAVLNDSGSYETMEEVRDALRAALATTDPAPDVEAAWEALTADMAQPYWSAGMTSEIVARHRPIIEAAIRAQGGGLDAETLAQRIHDEMRTDELLAPCSGTHLMGYATCQRFAALYARLRDTPKGSDNG